MNTDQNFFNISNTSMKKDDSINFSKKK